MIGERVVGERFHLPCGYFGQPLVAITQGDAPQARHGLDVIFAVIVRYPHALPALNNGSTTISVKLEIGQAMNDAARVAFAETMFHVCYSNDSACWQ